MAGWLAAACRLVSVEDAGRRAWTRAPLTPDWSKRVDGSYLVQPTRGRGRGEGGGEDLQCPPRIRSIGDPCSRGHPVARWSLVGRARTPRVGMLGRETTSSSGVWTGRVKGDGAAVRGRGTKSRRVCPGITRESRGATKDRFIDSQSPKGREGRSRRMGHQPPHRSRDLFCITRVAPPPSFSYVIFSVPFPHASSHCTHTGEAGQTHSIVR